MANPDKAPRPKRILIGFDANSGADDAVALARVLAPESSIVVLAYVPPHEDPLAHHYRQLDYEDSPAAEGFFEEAIAALEGLETEVRTYVGASPATCSATSPKTTTSIWSSSAHRIAAPSDAP